MFRHFHEAQEPVYGQVLAELRAGQKTSHWMWFIFPQIRGLGHSAMAQRFALDGLEEARRYLADPILGPRLRETTEAVLRHSNRSLRAIFGSPDDVKFVSSMTLSSQAAPGERLFREALERFNGGLEDPATLSRL
ncbi:DUF1810 domain-containing protein [Devosia submarina]|uniref:DUF1810 domain-containing protein n=1 Tax=Devosia submarina TaxID=1173082 RepID=UPI000D376A78|nr:DUF1810 domain-containing protein [Devosia submarina]